MSHSVMAKNNLTCVGISSQTVFNFEKLGFGDKIDSCSSTVCPLGGSTYSTDNKLTYSL